MADLGSLGRYLNGRGFKKSEWAHEGRPIIRIQNLTGSSGQFNYFKGAVDPKHEVEPGDLLMSWAATLGAYVWRGPSAVLNQHIFKVETFIDTDFHYYALQWALEALYRRAHGTGMVHVTKGRFDRTKVPLPPANEQRRIVEAIESYFTRIEDAVATLERVQRNLKHYRASVLKAAVEGRLVPTEAELARTEGRDFEPASLLLDRILAERRRRWEDAEWAKIRAKGKAPKDDRWKAKYKEPIAAEAADRPALPEGWRWTTVDALSWDGGYGTSRKCHADASGPPVLRIPNVQDETITFDDLKFATGGDDLPPDGVLIPGDFVFIRTNGSKSLIGRGALVVSPLPREYFFASYLIRLRLAACSTTAKWFALAWHVPVVRDQLLREAASSAGQHNVSLSAARNFLVPLPPLAEQERILSEVERLLSISDSTNSNVRPSITRAASLRQSVLKWAFEGRLVDQDPTDEPASRLLERIQAERESANGHPRRTSRRPSARPPKA